LIGLYWIKKMKDCKISSAGKLILSNEPNWIYHSENPLKQKRGLHKIASYWSASDKCGCASIFDSSPQELQFLA